MEVYATNSQAGMYFAMTTPKFDLITDHCFTFDYDMKKAHGLEVYIRKIDRVMAGRRVWQKKKGDGDNANWGTNGTTSINLKSTGFRSMTIDFVGIISSVDTIIRVANVKLEEGLCGNLTCADDEFSCASSGMCFSQLAVCNGSSECEDHSDEEPGLCGQYFLKIFKI